MQNVVDGAITIVAWFAFAFALYGNSGNGFSGNTVRPRLSLPPNLAIGGTRDTSHIADVSYAVIGGVRGTSEGVKGTSEKVPHVACLSTRVPVSAHASAHRGLTQRVH